MWYFMKSFMALPTDLVSSCDDVSVFCSGAAGSLVGGVVAQPRSRSIKVIARARLMGSLRARGEVLISTLHSFGGLSNELKSAKTNQKEDGKDG